MDLTPEAYARSIDAYVDSLGVADDDPRRSELRRHAELSTRLKATIESAYRAGREDAAREAESVFPTSTDAMRAFLARHRLPDTPSVGAMSVALLADVRAIGLGRSSQRAGDNPEEQKP